MTSTWAGDTVMTHPAMPCSVPVQAKNTPSADPRLSRPSAPMTPDSEPSFPSPPPTKTPDSSPPRPPPPQRPIAAEISTPEMLPQKAADPGSDRITKRLGSLLHDPCLEEHSDKLAVCSKINELRRSTVRCALGRACFHSDLTDLEWQQLDIALKLSPRVLDILRRVREDQRAMMRDTIEFRKGVEFLDQIIDDMPRSDLAAQTALNEIALQLTDIEKVKPGNMRV